MSDSCTGRGKHILLVEDHADLARAMAKLLSTVGFDVRVATTLRGATKDALNYPADLIIADLNLPDGSTINLLRDVRRRNGTPVIIVTGDADVETDGTIDHEDYVDCLIKPIDCDQLLASIERALHLSNH